MPFFVRRACSISGAGVRLKKNPLLRRGVLGKVAAYPVLTKEQNNAPHFARRHFQRRRLRSSFWCRPCPRQAGSGAASHRRHGQGSPNGAEELELKLTGVKVTGPDKKEVKTEGAMLMDGDKTFMVSLPAGLGAGTYKVEWHALSRDGHKTHGDYKFTVKP
jgi:hypothetical protein